MPKPALSSTTEQTLPGFFGKLPGRGDFIGRHLPKVFLEPWDRWLQAAIADSRECLGASWQDSYCTSPIWRFALSAGLCGTQAHTGVLMPSMDRVGRYYPLAIVAPLSPDWPLLMLPVDADDWFEQAEQLALDGLSSNKLDLDTFDGQVISLGVPQKMYVIDNNDRDDNAWYCPLPDSSQALSHSPMLAAYLLQRSFSRHSLWWTEGSEQITRCLLVCEGLPSPSRFAALLVGDWQQWGWQEKPLNCMDLSSGFDTAEKESE